MFVTVPHIQCDIKDCKKIFRGDPGIGTDEKSLIDQAGGQGEWVIAETNSYDLHFCTAQHARVFFSNLAEAVQRDKDTPFHDEHVNGADFFWNCFIGEQNRRAMEER